MTTIEPPPRDVPPFDMAVTRSVGAMRTWEGLHWRWDGSSWRPVPADQQAEGRT